MLVAVILACWIAAVVMQARDPTGRYTEAEWVLICTGWILWFAHLYAGI